MTVKKCLQMVIVSCPLGGIVVPIENHCLRPVPSPRASLPQAPRQLHLAVMAGGERHPQICLLFHLPSSHQESGVRNQCPGLWVCLPACLFFLPSPRFSPSAWWTAAIWKMPLFISSSLLKLPTQFSEANTIMGNQLIAWDVTFKKFCSFIFFIKPVSGTKCVRGPRSGAVVSPFPRPSRRVHKMITRRTASPKSRLFSFYQYMYIPDSGGRKYRKPVSYQEQLQLLSVFPRVGILTPRLRIMKSCFELQDTSVTFRSMLWAPSTLTSGFHSLTGAWNKVLIDLSHSCLPASSLLFLLCWDEQGSCPHFGVIPSKGGFKQSQRRWPCHCLFGLRVGYGEKETVQITKGRMLKARGCLLCSEYRLWGCWGRAPVTAARLCGGSVSHAALLLCTHTSQTAAPRLAGGKGTKSPAPALPNQTLHFTKIPKGFTAVGVKLLFCLHLLR